MTITARRFGPLLWGIAVGAMLSIAGGCEEEDLSYPDGAPPLPSPERPVGSEARATITHTLGTIELGPAQESVECYTWTLDNDAALYVESVWSVNTGSLHHSNWFVVPEDVYPGPDGFWPCEERAFNEVSAALSGTVLFAQSTQAWTERQEFSEGVVIRIPPRSKIVSDIHLLNLGPDARDTSGWLSLDVVHPELAETILSPVMLSYLDLNIPAMSEARFTGVCGFETLTNALPLSIHYVLPHYHGTGNYFSMVYEDYLGQETLITERSGFDASSLGETYDPPLVLQSAGELRFTCGYDNWYSEPLSWGIGIDEMCIAFALVESTRILVGGVDFGTSTLTDAGEGITNYEAPCQIISAPRGRAYEAPTFAERSAPLTLPPVDPTVPVPMPPACEDRSGDSSVPSTEATLDAVKARVFTPWCSFSSCHGNQAAAGLRLGGEDLHARLVNAPASANTSRPLVVPGDPDASFLYELVAKCQPQDDEGAFLRHMPANAPTLLDPELVGLLRSWIVAGAPA